jgi:hypothetical protein
MQLVEVAVQRAPSEASAQPLACARSRRPRRGQKLLPTALGDEAVACGQKLLSTARLLLAITVFDV